MAIRVISGGSDFTDDEVIKSADVNDTIDELYNLAANNPAFWLNSNFYDVYDDFESYGTGTFTTNSKWTVSGTASIVTSTNAGGTGDECRLGTNTTQTHYIESKTLSVDKHKFFRLGFANGTKGSASNNVTLTISVTLGGSTASVLVVDGADNTTITSGGICVLIVALGSDQYDVYAGGKKIISAVTDIDPQIRITFNQQQVTNTDTTYLYVDDVVESKNTIG